MKQREAVEQWARELRVVTRGLIREPRFAALVTVTLALAIGMNAAIFGIADRLLLRGPDHVQDPRNVVRLYETMQPPGRPDFQSGILSYMAYDMARTGVPALALAAAYNSEGSITMGHGADAELVTLGQATATLFPLLGVRPAAGRFFTEEEDHRDRPRHVVVLGHGLWQRAFAGRGDVLGQTVILGGVPYTIVGVAPRAFTGADLTRIDVWVPVSARGPAVSATWSRNWSSGWLSVIGRLRPGATMEQVGAQATALYRRAYDGTNAVLAAATFGAAPLHHSRDGREPTETAVARWLVGVSAIVLLIASANVTNLLLARGVKRRRWAAYTWNHR